MITKDGEIIRYCILDDKKERELLDLKLKGLNFLNLVVISAFTIIIILLLVLI